MSFEFKYAQHTEKETRFTELADGIRELIEADINWKENPRQLLKKVAEKVKGAESDSLLTFGETEMKFALFLADAVKQAAKAPTGKNPATVKILDRRLDNVMEREKDILTDMETIAQFMVLANRSSTQGISKFLDKPDSEILIDVKLSESNAILELNKVAGSEFRRKALE